MFSKVLTTKLAAVAAVLVLGGGTAAAATGSLPGPAQSAASTVLSQVGISLPGAGTLHPKHVQPNHPTHPVTPVGPPTNTGSRTATGDTSTGPSPNADFGLCTAEAANAGHPSSAATVFPSKTTCSTVVHPGSSSNSGSSNNSGTSSSHTTPAGPPSATPANSHARTTPAGSRIP